MTGFLCDLRDIVLLMCQMNSILYDRRGAQLKNIPLFYKINVGFLSYLTVKCNWSNCAKLLVVFYHKLFKWANHCDQFDCSWSKCFAWANNCTSCEIICFNWKGSSNHESKAKHHLEHLLSCTYYEATHQTLDQHGQGDEYLAVSFVLNLSLTRSRGAQMVSPCRLQGQSPNSLPVIVLYSQLDQKERPRTYFANGPMRKELMSATSPRRNVTFGKLLLSFFIVFDMVTIYSPLHIIVAFHTQ